MMKNKSSYVTRSNNETAHKIENQQIGQIKITIKKKTGRTEEEKNTIK